MAPDPAIPAVVLSVMGLLPVAAATRALSRRTGVPFPIALVLVGRALSWLGAVDLAVLRPVAGLRIPPEVVFYVFLPTLVSRRRSTSTCATSGRTWGPSSRWPFPGWCSRRW